MKPETKVEKEEKLRRAFESIQCQLHQIEAVRKRRLNAKYVGRCFKYHNSYGGGDRWWLYARITKGGQWMTAHQFEHTAHDRFETRTDGFMSSMDSWIEISHKEFETEWRAFLKKIEALGK